MVSIQVSNLFTNWYLHTLTKDMADKHSFGSGVSVHFLSSGALKSKGKLDKVVWDRFYALRKELNCRLVGKSWVDHVYTKGVQTDNFQAICRKIQY